MMLEKKGNSELRCECGSLLARLVKDRLEIKCRRCKRVMVIPIAAAKKVMEITELHIHKQLKPSGV